MQKDYELVEFTEPSLFREWLTCNVNQQQGIWLRLYKKASGVQSITYAEALDEALCFGWIDGMRKSYDEQSYIQKFTPRRKQSLWSKRNIEHIERLRANGRMTSAGESEVQRAIQDGRWDSAYDSPSVMVVPDDLMKWLNADESTKIAFEKLSKSAKYAILWQLQTARTEATRLRRMEKLISGLTNRESNP